MGMAHLIRAIHLRRKYTEQEATADREQIMIKIKETILLFVYYSYHIFS